MFAKCAEEDFGYGASNIARERRRVPGDVAGSVFGFGGSGGGRDVEDLLLKPASG